MLSFLFWNICRKPLQDQLVRLAALHDVDVLILVESGFAPATLLDALKRDVDTRYGYPFSEGDRIQIFTRFPETSLQDVFNSPLSRLTIRRLHLDTRLDLLISALHFQSKRNWSRVDQTLEATGIARDIVRAEDRLHCDRSILVGDMNMNPFEPGLVGAQALNAVMTKNLAKMLKRTVAGRSYRYFYNPMWGLFGDRTPGPAGTYFYNAASPTNQYWHLFDQVLLRPALIDTLVHLEILDSDGAHPLVTKRSGRPSKSTASDHLPILFRLDL